MCFDFLWRKSTPTIIVTSESPIVISPFLQPIQMYTPIIPKRCSICDKILYKKVQYHKECYHSERFKRMKKKYKERRERMAYSF